MKKIVLLSALLFAVIAGFSQIATNGGYHPSAGGGYHGNGGYNMGPPAMSDCDFRRACEAVSRQAFDDDKLRVAQQVAVANRLSALQVRDMAKLMTFEDTKLDFAQYAYTRVIDPQNYYVVNDAFTFSSSIADLVAYTNTVGYSGGATCTSTYGGMNGGGHGGSGSGSGHGGHGHGQGGHGHVCNSGCNHGGGNGGGHGQNGYYGGSVVTSTTVSGGGNGMVYHGQINSVPVVPAIPMCGMCSGHHALNIVCEREFANIAGAVCNRTFEDDKLLVAKQAIGCKLVSADQVRRLMCKFTFESTKLDFAKWAYRHCWDAQNYYIVNDAFTFSSSIRELDDFIRFG